MSRPSAMAPVGKGDGIAVMAVGDVIAAEVVGEAGERDDN